MFKLNSKSSIAALIVFLTIIACFSQNSFFAIGQGLTGIQPNIATTSSSTPPTPSFTIKVSPTSLILTPGEEKTAKITITPIGTFSGTVNLAASDVEGLILKLNQTSVILQSGETASILLSIKAQPKIEPGSTKVTITASAGASILTQTATINVKLPDFKISDNKSPLYIIAGTTENSMLTINSCNYFNGTVDLSVSGPQGWQVPKLGQNSISVAYPKPQSDKTTLSVAAPVDAKPGKYYMLITGQYSEHGKSHEITHSLNVTVQVINPNMKICPATSTLYLLPDSKQDVSVRIYSIHRFNDTKVTLSASSTNPKITATIAPSIVTVLYNKAGESTLSIAVPKDINAGKNNITITATNGKITQEYKILLQIIKPDFTVNVSPSYASYPAGTTINATVRATSVYRYNGTITLTNSNTPFTVTYDQKTLPSTLPLKCNSATVKVTIQIPQDTEPGKYSIDFIGTAPQNALPYSQIATDITTVKIVISP